MVPIKTHLKSLQLLVFNQQMYGFTPKEQSVL